MEDGLEISLRSWAPIGDLVKFTVSGATRYRIYPAGKVPQSVAYPYISYQRISTEDLMSHEGYNQMTTARMQIDVWAMTHREAKNLAHKVRDYFRGFKGMMGSTEVLACLPEGMIYLPEDAIAGGPTGIEHYALDFAISYRE